MSGKLPDGWRLDTLANLTEQVKRGAAPSYALEPTGIFAISQKCVRDGSIDLSVARPHNPTKAIPAKACLRPGDVCVNSTGTGTLGRVALWECNDEKFFADTHVTIVRPDKGRVEPLMLAAYLSAPSTTETIYRECVTGSTNQIELNAIAFSQLMVPVPPLDEQRRIAEVLRSVDEAIAASQSALDFCVDLLDSKRRNAFRHLLVEPDAAAFRLRDICELGRGFAFKSGDYVDDGVLNFRVTNVGRPLSDLGEQRFLPESFMEEYEEYVLAGGEIVLVMVGATVGKLGRVPTAVCPALLNQNMWTLIPKKPFGPELVWHLAHVLIEEKVHGAQGGAYSFLTKKDFLQHRISRFDLAEMNEVVSQLSAMETYIEHLADATRQKRQLKEALMSDLLSGRVRVPA